MSTTNFNDPIEVFALSQARLEEAANRARKPRSNGITMILVFDLANFGPEFIREYSQLVDKVKVMDTMWHDDPTLLARSINAYRDMDISVACGGTQFELATAQGSLDSYVSALKGLGVTEVEVEHHADEVGLDQLKREVDYFKTQGFSVIGEVGKKWWWKDPTRVTRDAISVEKTVETVETFLQAGADWVYWEGAIVGGLIGRQLENAAGQEQLIEVVNAINDDKLVLEVYDRRGQPVYPMIAWLVKQFGPNVNLANIEPWHVKRVEWMRHGITYEMDHPYMRWSADTSVAENWWSLPDVPDYSIDVQRPYSFDS